MRKEQSPLTKIWDRAAKPLAAISIVAAFGTAAMKRQELWDLDWEKLSYITTVAAYTFTPLAALWEWRKNRLAKERGNELEAEENEIERRENELRREENRIRVQENYLELDENYRSEQRWYADYLREDKTHELTERTHYSNLLNIAEKGHILFIHPKDSFLADMKDSWIDTIDEIVEDPGFIKTLLKNPALLVGENVNFVKYFVGRMQSKWTPHQFDSFMTARAAIRREAPSMEFQI